MKLYTIDSPGKNQNLHDIVVKIKPILLKAGVTRSSLFGSIVRGDDTRDSDVDILIDTPAGMSLFDLVRLQRRLAESLGKKVDLLTYNSVHPLLKDYIERDQLRIL